MEVCCTGDGVGGGAVCCIRRRRVLGEVFFWALGEGFGLHPWLQNGIQRQIFKTRRELSFGCPMSSSFLHRRQLNKPCAQKVTQTASALHAILPPSHHHIQHFADVGSSVFALDIVMVFFLPVASRDAEDGGGGSSQHHGPLLWRSREDLQGFVR